MSGRQKRPIRKPANEFPLGHFDPAHLAKTFMVECSLIGGLVIAWGQLDREVAGLFNRLLGFDYMQPPDKRALALFYTSTNTKARRDWLTSLIKTIDDQLCREWLDRAVESIGDAAEKRNNVIHSEYFADLQDRSDSHMTQTTPARKNPEVVRHKILYQVQEAITAMDDARFYMEFAYCAVRSRDDLLQALAFYETALRKRFAPQQPHNRPPDSR